MKLDNYELTVQRVKLLKEIVELQDHLDVLKENVAYVFPLEKMPGVFFRIKDIVYLLVTQNSDINMDAGIIDVVKGLPTAIFKVLDDSKDVEYYNTVEGKLEALDRFAQYIEEDVSTVLHELVHIDDQKNGINRADDKSVSNDPYEYYNHPAEIRAYTQQNLYIMQNEIMEAIAKGEIRTKAELKNFCRIYRNYKKIFMKSNTKNNFFYWKPSVFNDYLENLDFIIDTLGSKLAN